MTDDDKKLNEYIEDMARLPFEPRFFIGKYGESNVSNWINDPAIKTMVNERRSQITASRSKEHDLLFENWGMLKGLAFDSVVKILKAPDHPEHGRTARWLLQGEHSYVSKIGEIKGEQAATKSNTKLGVVINYLRPKLVDDDGNAT